MTRDGGEELDEDHAAGSAGLRARQPDRGVAARRGHRLPGGQPLPARRSRAVRLPDARTTARPGRRSSSGIRPDDFPRVDRRGPEAQGAAVPRHRDRRLRLVRRRRRVAAVQPRAAGDAGARRPGQERRPRDRHARALVLRDGQHQRAAPDRRAARPTSRSSCSSPSMRSAVGARAAWRWTTYLKQPADKVTIEVLDAQGKSIKTFTGTPRRRHAGDACAAPSGEEFVRPAPASRGRQAGVEPVRVGLCAIRTPRRSRA